MSDNPWPPEGTRVVIKFTGQHGTLERWNGNWVVQIDNTITKCFVYRHEIEVIDDMRTE